MSASLHSPTNRPDQQSARKTGQPVHLTEQPNVTRVTARPVRADGFGNRFPVMFDHRDDIPTRELAHWGPGSRILLQCFLIPALVVIAAAVIAIAWFVA